LAATNHNHKGDVSIYSIYKETNSSVDPATRERQYAGWAADQDNAIQRANEIYKSRDTIEAVLVIGNGLRGVEVLYRIDGT
jgi:hypothetical protein